MRPALKSVAHMQKRRRQAKRRHWSARSRYQPPSVRRLLHLPTRRTLTYAEAQQFVDVYVNGSVSRLNVLEPLCVVDEADGKQYDDSECCSAELPAETNGQVAPTSGQTVVNSQQVSKSSHAVISSHQVSKSCVMSSQPAAYYRHVEKTPEELNEEVEYDTDEQVFSFTFSRIFATCLVVKRSEF